MTNLPPSSSDAALSGASSSFDLLAEPVQRWIWQKQWHALRDIQERAIPAIVKADRDLIIAAATAEGKTEAAFLPLLSRLLGTDRSGKGFELLYVSPLKALINDQFRRLDDLCEAIEVPVHRWHGDVSAAAKAKARRQPRGILLITPESLEATFVLRGLEVPGLFAGLQCIVIDELHAMLDTERGMHLRSLLNRIEIALGRQVRRIGLSATLGDMQLASAYLRPEAPGDVDVLESDAEGHELKLQLRGYAVSGKAPAPTADATVPPGDAELATDRAIAQHIFENLRGKQNLIFAGSRQKVELYADTLRLMCEEARLPNEFFAHHANLARDHRDFVEQRLKAADEPTSAICTSTLELGIDIGEVESIAQIGSPFSVASMRQRLGRSGRREGKPAVMRIYIQEKALDSATHPFDELRLQLVQSIAMVNLLLDNWCEPPKPEALHLSTLVHQILSVITEHNGARAADLFGILCERGPFAAVDRGLFIQVLRCLGGPESGLIEQSPDGILMLGAAGERLVEHYEFYSVFMTPEEYRIISSGRTLGTLPILFPLMPKMTIVFSGRRWRVVEVQDREKAVIVIPDQTGRPPRFGGDGGDLHDRVARTMRDIYLDQAVPPYLDQTAREFLSEGRAAFARFGLADRSHLQTGDQRTVLFPWRGTISTQSLAMALTALGLPASPSHVAIEVSGSVEDVLVALKELSAGAIPDATELASHMKNLMSQKFHPYLSQPLLEIDAASSRIDAIVVPALASQLLTQ